MTNNFKFGCGSERKNMARILSELVVANKLKEVTN